MHRPLDDVRVRVPASPSVAARELVLSAIADGTSRLDLGPVAPGRAIRALRATVAALGYRIDDEPDGVLRVAGAGGPAFARPALEIDPTSTTAAAALALAALGPARTTLLGGARSLEPLLAALAALGARVERDDGAVVVVVGPVAGGTAEVRGEGAEGAAAALLLIAARLAEGLRLHVDRADAAAIEGASASLKARRVEMTVQADGLLEVAPQRVRSRDVTIPGDAMAALIPAVAAAVLGGSVTLEGVEAAPRRATRGAAHAFVLLEAMGCAVARSGARIRVRRDGTLFGVVAEVRECPDAFPLLAVAAACAAGPSELTGIGHARRATGDRVALVAAGLRALGADVTTGADALRIMPTPLHGGAVDAASDAWIAFAFSVLALAVPGVAIDNGDVVDAEYPAFSALLRDLAR